MPERIQLGMSVRDIVMTMCDGNPGGLRVMLDMTQHAEKIDPDSAFGHFSPLMQLDTLGIYGSHIWILYKDCCGQSLVKTMAVLRAAQLGILPFVVVQNAASGLLQMDFSNDEVLLKVQEQLPNFGKATE